MTGAAQLHVLYLWIYTQVVDMCVRARVCGYVQINTPCMFRCSPQVYPDVHSTPASCWWLENGTPEKRRTNTWINTRPVRTIFRSSRSPSCLQSKQQWQIYQYKALRLHLCCSEEGENYIYIFLIWNVMQQSFIPYCIKCKIQYLPVLLLLQLLWWNIVHTTEEVTDNSSVFGYEKQLY